MEIIEKKKEITVFVCPTCKKEHSDYASAKICADSHKEYKYEIGSIVNFTLDVAGLCTREIGEVMYRFTKNDENYYNIDYDGEVFPIHEKHIDHVVRTRAECEQQKEPLYKVLRQLSYDVGWAIIFERNEFVLKIYG